MAKSIQESLTPGLDRLLLRSQGLEHPIPVPWPSWSKAVGGGLYPGLYAFVGGTGVGKTQLAVQWLDYVAQLGFPGSYIGLEMNSTDLAARILSLHSERSWSDYIMGVVPEAQLKADIEEHWAKIEQLPVRTEFAPPNGWSYELLVSAVRDLQKAHKERIEQGYTPIIVLDYLQLVASPNPSESTKERITKAAYLGRSIASSCNAVVFMISSTSRSNYEAMSGAKNDSGFRPWQDDPNLLVGVGKESGDLEYACDGLFVGVRQPRTTNVWIGAAKFRLGKPKWVCMHFDGARMHEGPGKKLAQNMEQAREMVLKSMQLGRPYSPDLFLKLSGLEASGDAATLRAELLQDGLIEVAKDGTSVVKVDAGLEDLE